MKSIDLMIFDFDGTLVNSGMDIAASVNHTLEMLGVPQKSVDTIIRFIGDGVKELIVKSIGPDNEDRYDEAMDIFSSHYSEHMLDRTSLYDHALDVLRHFQEKKKIIITNKRECFTRPMAKAFAITTYFEEIIGADSTPYKKPDSRLLYPVMERYGAAPDKTLVIGDGVNDLLLARQAGVLSCALLNGLTQRDILLSLNPDFFCDDISELMQLFI